MTRRAHRTHDARRRPAARMEYNARRGRPGVDKKMDGRIATPS
ncbi:hypothetical protein C7S17_7377 [Burkholderia thailandensis]|nr:hypothetical protein [Burkholderia thailandensis]